MTTDLKRLEQTKKAAHFGARGIGRTHYAAYHTVKALKDSAPGATFAWLVPSYNWLDHIVPMVYSIMNELGVSGYRFEDGHARIIDTDGRRILFVKITIDEWFRIGSVYNLDRLRGRDFVFVDDLGECLDYLFENWRMNALLHMSAKRSPKVAVQVPWAQEPDDCY